MTPQPSTTYCSTLAERLNLREWIICFNLPVRSRWSTETLPESVSSHMNSSTCSDPNRGPLKMNTQVPKCKPLQITVSKLLTGSALRRRGAKWTSNNKLYLKRQALHAFFFLPGSENPPNCRRERETEPSVPCRAPRGSESPGCLRHSPTDTLSSEFLGRDVKDTVRAEPICHDAWGNAVAPLARKACGRRRNAQSKSSIEGFVTKPRRTAVYPSVYVTFQTFGLCEIMLRTPPSQPLKHTRSPRTRTHSRRTLPISYLSQSYRSAWVHAGAQAHACKCLHAPLVSSIFSLPTEDLFEAHSGNTRTGNSEFSVGDNHKAVVFRKSCRDWSQHINVPQLWACSLKYGVVRNIFEEVRIFWPVPAVLS